MFLTYTYNSVFCIGVKKCYISEFLDSVMALYYDLLSFQLLGLDGSLVFLVGKLSQIEFYFPLLSVNVVYKASLYYKHSL